MPSIAIPPFGGLGAVAAWGADLLAGVNDEDSPTEIRRLAANAPDWEVLVQPEGTFAQIDGFWTGGVNVLAAGSFVGADRGNGEFSDLRAAIWQAQRSGEWKRFDLTGAAARATAVTGNFVSGSDVSYTAIGETAILDRGDAGSCATPAAWNSPDTRSWREAKPLGDDRCAALLAMANDGNRLAAVGTSIWTSSNGSTWVESATLDISDFVPVTTLSSVAAGAHAFVAIGQDCSAQCRAIVWRSTDGVTWEQADAPTEHGSNAQIVWLDDRYFALWGNSAFESPDGLLWMKVEGPPGTDGQGYRLTALNGAPVVAGMRDGKVWRRVGTSS